MLIPRHYIYLDVLQHFTTGKFGEETFQSKSRCCCLANSDNSCFSTRLTFDLPQGFRTICLGYKWQASS